MDNRLPQPFILPMPRDREASPKRKRTVDPGENTEHVCVNAGAGVPRLPRPQCNLIEASAMRSTAGHTNDRDKPTLKEQVDAYLQRVEDHYARQRFRTETTFNRRLVNAMTAAQITQSRGCRDLLVLTDKLHEWARHLDAQERWLHQQQAELIEQQQDLTMKLLDAAVERVETNLNLAEETLEPSKAEQIVQLTNTVGTLETTIEVLISELMIEREARKAAEKKLQAKQNAGEGVVDDDAFSNSSTIASPATDPTGEVRIVPDANSVPSPAKSMVDEALVTGWLRASSP